MTCWTATISSPYFLRWLADVNDWNFWLWRMLIVDADCEHIYVDPQTIFDAMVPQTFLSLTDTPSTYTWFWSWIVRVNSTATWLEFVDPSSLNIWIDRLVASQLWAIPNYLWTVLDVVTWELTKTISWNKVILWIDPALLSSLSTDFLSLTDTPSSYSGQAWKIVVVNSTSSWLEFEDWLWKNLWWRRYMASDYSITRWINLPDLAFVITWMNWYEWVASMEWDYFGTPSIVIPKTWVYKVNVKWNVELTPWVLAARVFAYSSLPTAIIPMCDSKIWSLDPGSWHWAFPWSMVTSYWQSMLYRFEEWTHIITGWIISTNVWVFPTAATWTVTVLHGNVFWSGIDDRWHILEVSRFSSDYI